MSENPVQQMLDRCGVPWRSSQEFLRAGGRAFADPTGTGLEMIAVDGQPVTGLLHPLHFASAPDDDPALPPLLLCGYAVKAGDGSALGSLAAATADLSEHLGAPEPFDGANTRGWRWAHGPSSVELICFPPPLDADMAETRQGWEDDRLADATWLNIETGYRPALDPAEAADVEAFVPAHDLPNIIPPEEAFTSRPQQHVLEYVREPSAAAARMTGRIGRSRDGGTILFVTDQLYLVPAGEVLQIRVDRVRPGRGSGFAVASLVCRSRRLGAEKTISLAYCGATDGLDAFGPRVAVWLGCPCELRPCEADY